MSQPAPSADAVASPAAQELQSTVRGLLAMAANGDSLAGVMQLSPDQVQAYHAAARQLFRQGQFADALSVFRWLCLLDFTEPEYRLGLAGCLQSLGQHEEAMGQYAQAWLMDCDDPFPQFQICECLMALGRLEDALEGFTELLGDCQPGVHDDLQARAQGWIALLQQQTTAPQGLHQ